MEIRLEDFKRCCRCCLVMVNALKPLFGDSLDEMLRRLMNFQVTQNDGYPQQICTQCILKLSSAHTFYLTVTKNQTILENILKAAEANGKQLTMEDRCKQEKESNTWKEELDTMEKVPYNQPGNDILEMTYAESGSENSSDKEEDYECSQCEHTSKDQEQLQAHLQTHLVAAGPKGEEDSAVHLCNYCGARFRRRTSLYKHVRRHRGIVHQCRHCPKQFSEASCLNVHMISHSVDNPKPFHCTKCGRSFTQKSSLKKHEELHTTRRKLQCEQCEKSFLYKSSLRRHRESAHEPDECSLCSKLFSGKKFLDAHMRSHKKDETAKLKIEKPADSTMPESINMQPVTVEFLCLMCENKFQSRKRLEVRTTGSSSGQFHEAKSYKLQAEVPF